MCGVFWIQRIILCHLFSLSACILKYFSFLPVLYFQASSNATVVTFIDLFRGIVDDIVPPGRGPHLFLSYLKNWYCFIEAHCCHLKKKNSLIEQTLVSN